jgi:hypothetical protein
MNLWRWHRRAVDLFPTNEVKMPQRWGIGFPSAAVVFVNAPFDNPRSIPQASHGSMDATLAIDHSR